MKKFLLILVALIFPQLVQAQIKNLIGSDFKYSVTSITIVQDTLKLWSASWANTELNLSKGKYEIEIVGKAMIAPKPSGYPIIELAITTNTNIVASFILTDDRQYLSYKKTIDLTTSGATRWFIHMQKDYKSGSEDRNAFIWQMNIKPADSIPQPDEVVSDTLVVEWNQVPDTDLAGYRIFQGYAPRSYTSVIGVGRILKYLYVATKWDTTYFFTATAVDSSGNESVQGNEAFIRLLKPKVTSIDIASPVPNQIINTDSVIVLFTLLNIPIDSVYTLEIVSPRGNILTSQAVNGNYRASFKGMIDGNYFVGIRIKNKEFVIITASTVNFTVHIDDIIPPQSPTIRVRRLHP